MFLKIGTGIGRPSPLVQPALVADADAVGVVASGMRTGTFQRPERLISPFLRMDNDEVDESHFEL